MSNISVDLNYIISVRRELHMYPEVGFDLPKTLEIIKRELDAMGIPYTDRYGKSSLVGYIGEGEKCIALRADIDALPITEETNLEYASRNEGKMHACGHDTHTAMLLGTAKMLKAVEGELKVKVLLIFQAAEEYAPGGAKLMCEDGVMDGVDAIIGAHINEDIPLGEIALNYSAMSATSHGFYLDFYGKSCHVSTPQNGVDAIAMAACAYNEIQMMRARELNPKEPVVIGIGEFHGGSANNIVCDHVRMHGTIRTTSNEVDEYIYSRIEGIASAISSSMGGSYSLETTKHYPSIINTPSVAEVIVDLAREVLGEGKCNDKKECMMGGEDFAFYLLRGKGAFFHIGMKSDRYTFAPCHSSKFIVDEAAMEIGPRIFFGFVEAYSRKLISM